MPEATMLCCDCSEYMRNGDLMPTRFDSQKDALGVISNAKTEQNQENTIGLISMGGNGKADVLVNCTSDVGRVLAAADKMKIDGKADILIALQTSQLALKHRKNKKQDQRIILFVGSPVECSEKLLIKAGKRLKKNNVAVDVINFGEVEHNVSILEAFLNAVNSNDNSHLVSVATSGLISEAIISSAIFIQQGAINEFAGIGDANADVVSGANVGGGGGGGNEVDPNVDPELAMAIRMSLEAERQRREMEAKQAHDENPQAAAQQPKDQAQPQPQQQPASQLPRDPMDIANDNADDAKDDEAELLQALQMSMMAENQNNDQADDEVISKEKKPSGGIEAMLNDEAFLDELVSALPGIDKKDIDIKDLLGAADQNADKKDDKDKEKDKDNKNKDDKNDKKDDKDKQ